VNIDFRERNCKVSISILTTNDGHHFILCFERSAPVEKLPVQAPFVPGGRTPVTPANSTDSVPQDAEIPNGFQVPTDTFFLDGRPPITPANSEHIEGSTIPNGFKFAFDTSAETSKTIAQLKMAIFDSCEVGGFILSEDEQFYLTNKKLREQIGDVMGGARGCEALCNLLSQSVEVGLIADAQLGISADSLLKVSDSCFQS
jgi:hypothetical protein